MSFKYLGGYLSATYDALGDGFYKGVWTLKDVIYALSLSRWSGIVPAGQDQYTSVGTYSWTAPAGVTSVSVVCIGTSQKWANNARYGRGGGGLGYKNNIPVIPGNSYTVQVGSASSGTSSYFISTATVEGQPSSGNSTGGGYTGDGGGNGGDGGTYFGSGIGAGGGGAGGYAGNGGNGAPSGAFSGSPAATNSGGGGGGAGGTSSSFGAGGGGVGIWGLGPDGVGGVYNSGSGVTSTGGGGGSYGNVGAASNTGGAGSPAIYGGGTAGTQASVSGGGDTNGAVRIIYGSGRAFPSTLTSNQ